MAVYSRPNNCGLRKSIDFRDYSMKFGLDQAARQVEVEIDILISRKDSKKIAGKELWYSLDTVHYAVNGSSPLIKQSTLKKLGETQII